MLRYYRTNPGMRIEVRRLGFMLALAGLLFGLGLHLCRSFPDEVHVYETVCRELSANSTVGRQALVSSVWWPPLAFLLRWPLSVVTGEADYPYASLLVSALFGAAVLFGLERMLRDGGAGRERWLIALGAVTPAFFVASLSGTTATTVVFLTLWVAHNLTQWLRRRNLRNLVRLAYGSALLLAAGCEMGIWLLGVYAILALDMFLYEKDRRKREASLIVAVLPLVYGIAAWMLFNWLVMGDALYFVRSLWMGQAERASWDLASWTHGWTTVLASASLGGALVAAVRRDRATAYLGALAAFSCLVARVTHAWGWSASAERILHVAWPLALLFWGLFWSRWLPAGGWRLVPAGVLLALGVCFWRIEGASTLQSRPSLTDLSIPAQVELHVRTRARDPIVMVCGYEGFALLRERRDPGVFVHSLDFDFKAVETAYFGHEIYLLMRAPEGRGAMESIHWKYTRFYRRGGGTALMDRDWGEWRLFEVVQPPHDDR